MKENLSIAGILLFISFVAWILIQDDIFPMVMIIVKWILVVICFISTLGAAGYLTNLIKGSLQLGSLFTSWKSSLVNLLTLYRLIISPVLLYFLFTDHSYFKWILLSAFITDALDGFLARRFKVTSPAGARLDSIADDVLFVVSAVSIIYLHAEIISDHVTGICFMIFIFVIKMASLWAFHKKMISGMHTYLTKLAAVIQAGFFLHCIFFQPNHIFFTVMCLSTIIAMSEELIIILSRKEIRPDMKGLFFK